MSAYDVLSRFSETVTGGFPTSELPARWRSCSREGTGAAWAQVWLTAQERPTLAATWPLGRRRRQRTTASWRRQRRRCGGRPSHRVVRHGGHVYGVLRLQEQPGLPLSPTEERLFTGLAAQAGLVLRLVGLQADLAARRDELATRAAELRASRDRLIATQDAERRRLERDMHDGAQQHLVALAVNLRLAETLAPRDPERAVGLLAGQASAAREAIATLSDLSRGIYPRPLDTDGLVAALRAAVVAQPGAGPRVGPRRRAAACGRRAGAVLRGPRGAAERRQARRRAARPRQSDRGARTPQVSVADDGTGFDAAGSTRRSRAPPSRNMRRPDRRCSAARCRSSRLPVEGCS